MKKALVILWLFGMAVVFAAMIYAIGALFDVVFTLFGTIGVFCALILLVFGCLYVHC